MNMLGWVLPALIFQHSDQLQYLECNDRRTKSSSVDDLSRPMEKSVEESSVGAKFHDNLMCLGSCKQASSCKQYLDGLDEPSRHSCNNNRTAGIASTSCNVDEPAKVTLKKKKKKRKFKKKPTGNKIVSVAVDMASPSNSNQSSCRETSSGTGPGTNGRNQYNAVDSTLGFNKVDKSCNVKSITEHDKDSGTISGSAALISDTGWENMGACLESTADSDANLFTMPSCHGNSDLMGSSTLPQDSVCSSMETSETRSIATMPTSGRSSMNQHKSITGYDNDSLNGRNIEEANSCFGPLNASANCSCSLKLAMSKREACEDDVVGEAKSCNQCYRVTNDPAVAPLTNFKHDEGQSDTSTNLLQMPSHVDKHNHFGKENKFAWQNTREKFGRIWADGRKKCNHIHKCMTADSPDYTSLMKHYPLAGDGLLPPTQLSYSGEDGVQRRAIGDQGEKHRSRGYIMTESPECAAQRRSLAGLHLGMSISGEDYATSTTWEKLKYRRNQSFNNEDVFHHKRGSWVSKTSLCKPHNRSNIAYREALEVPRTVFLHRNNLPGRSSHNSHEHIFNISEAHEFECASSFPAHPFANLHWQWNRTLDHPKLLHEIQPHTRTKVPSTEDISSETFHASLDNEDKSPSSFELKITGNRNFKECITSRFSSQKWIPVCKKDSLMLKTSGDIDGISGTKVEVYEKSNCVSSDEVGSVINVGNDLLQNGLANGRTANLFGKSKIDYSAFDSKSKYLAMYIGSDMAMQLLNAVHRLQIASDIVQLTIGSPIAEFENFLYSASPVIVSSFVQEQSNGSIRYDKVLNSFSEFQIPDVPLRDVWNWYERPGNYGLEVKAEESQNFEVLDTKARSFQAHFVPFLSALQLFRHSLHSSTGSRPGNESADLLEKGAEEDCSLPSSSHLCSETVSETNVSGPFNLAEKRTRLFHLTSSDGEIICDSVSAFCSSYDSEVIFEYFEHEPPQQRKPLHAKVKELVEICSSSSLVFGDPSVLECISLQDLHPASWYAVAWYPIYRIPEGSFRASFLTYHSLGNWALRCNRSDSVKKNAFSMISPVLGMQSYNAQGECWFHPKKSDESVLIDGTPFNSSDILKERLRTLQDAAAIFARGNVYKDHVTVANRQPDYEFFLSRKQ